MIVVYIAGPMTGLPDYNAPAFREAQRRLDEHGLATINPARHGLIDGWTWQDYMRAALHDVASADGIALLPGWEKSKGAQLERHVATELGLDVRPLNAWLT